MSRHITERVAVDESEIENEDLGPDDGTEDDRKPVTDETTLEQDTKKIDSMLPQDDGSGDDHFIHDNKEMIIVFAISGIIITLSVVAYLCLRKGNKG